MPFLLLSHACALLSVLPPGGSGEVPEENGKAPQTVQDERLRLEALRAELRELLEEVPPETSPDAPIVTIGPGGLRIRSADGESSMKIGGRIQADATVHERKGGLNPLIQDGTELRRARFELKGTLPSNLLWAAEVDFASNNTSLKDFWLAYAVEDGPTVFFGHQKQPYSLDVEMSSNDIPFVERGIDSFLILPFIDRAIGVRVQDDCGSLFYALGLYGESVTPNAVDDEGWGVAGRLVHAPVRTDHEVVHLGLRSAFRQPEDGSQMVRIRDETTNMSNFAVVDTGMLTNVNDVLLVGAEAVWARGPFSIGGEYNAVTVDQPGRDLDFRSWHVQSTYSLTGESRARAYRIDAGEFKRLRAEREGDRPWEVAARLASLDLQDGAVAGGEEHALSVGLNWYFSANLRLMWNWTHVLDTSGGAPTTARAEGLDLFSFRAQLVF